MKKYKCPYCENESYTLVQKIFAGGMASRGTACPKCGKHSVHGLAATITDTVIMAAALIYIIIDYKSGSPDMIKCIALFAGAYLLCRIINGLFFDLTENNRREGR